MSSALSTACSSDVDGVETHHGGKDKDEASCAMSTGVPPQPHDGADSKFAADETSDGRTVKDENHRGIKDASLPLYDQTGDLDEMARCRTERARVFHVIGLALELSSTLWAFEQAVSAGALIVADCSFQSRLSQQYISSRAVGNCDGPVDSSRVLNSTSAMNFFQFGVSLENPEIEEYALKEHVGCHDLTANPTAEDRFERRCECCFFYEESDYPACSWIPLSSPSNGICYAQGVLTNTSDGTMMAFSDFSAQKCWPKHPPGTAMLTITALVVALSSQLVEAFVGCKYWRNTKSENAPILAAAVFQALGVLVVSSVLLALPGFFNASEYVSERIPTFYVLTWTTVTLVVVGALAETTAVCSDRAFRRVPYIGGVGNGLVWLGSALLEMVITTYLLWTGTGVRDVTSLVVEAAGLFTLELLGLIVMWIARSLWLSATLLKMSVKSLKGPVKKTVDSTRRTRSKQLQGFKAFRTKICT